MTTTQKRRAYAYGRDHEFTKKEYDALMSEFKDAVKRDDQELVNKLIRKIPMEPEVLMAFGSTLGKNFILEVGYDLTQANMRYGEGWLDELKSEP